MLKTYWLQQEILNNLMIEKFPIEMFTASFIYSTSITFHSVPSTLLDTSITGKDETKSEPSRGRGRE